MNKKAMTLQVMIGILIFSIAGISILFWIFSPGEGLAGKIQALTPVTEFPDITTTKPQLKEIEVSSEANAVYDTIRDALEKGKASTKSQCIIIYDEFPDLQDFKIILASATDGTNMYILDPNERIAKQFAINDIRPCAIAGGDAARIFLYNKRTPLVVERFPEFTEFNLLAITGKVDLIADDKEYDLEDEGLKIGGREVSLLYKADSNHVCFFTTFDGDLAGICNANEDGLDDDCIRHFLPGEKYNQFIPGGEPLIPFC